MVAVLVYAVALVLAALFSSLARRSVLSTSVLFLGAGVVTGPGVLGLVDVQPDSPLVMWLAEVALVTVLFSDGMRTPLQELTRAASLPARALLVGMPLTFGLIALLGHLLADLRWPEALLLAAVLSPTDPVFASALAGERAVPRGLRQLLNVESAVNDGIALPAVVVLLELCSRDPLRPLPLLLEVAGGVALGLAIPWLVLQLARLRALGASDDYLPLGSFGLGLTVFAVAKLTHANEFLAVFAAGVTISTVAPRARPAFARFGELLTELFKLAALLLFGALMSPHLLKGLSAGDWAFALLALLLARPVGLLLSLVGSPLTGKERLAGAWFGPRGFATVVYSLQVLQSGIPGARKLFHLAALVVAASVIAHSSTDTVIARRFMGPEEEEPEPSDPDAGSSGEEPVPR
ncbi:sodium:proton antiporter [Aggregicoccus sp. 17bor-14]|uniref:cation:proton antiporter n=1 Tax=Myxococcaceae TaxID=31 RepID=UPI00129C640C|nr:MULTISPECIES: cation:proton antiporter [Myxococcaceae]MBF5046498.1 cation:proton antiporter [Simulacricoccus sp. 17bor-14]MRI92214.1 sodium:proton antiporter [Aggregicoccus sp. 17bor-14]